MANSAIATLRVVDHEVAARPCPDDLARVSAPLTSTLTAELDGAVSYLDVPAEEILLAAVSRAIGRVIGDGDVAVDVNANGHFTVVLGRMSTRSASATKVLRAVHRSLAAARFDIGGPPLPSVDVAFSYFGAVPEPVSHDALLSHEMLPSLGHALEVRVYRTAGVDHMDWWYDTRRLDRPTVEELTEQFPLALIDFTSDAVPPIRDLRTWPWPRFCATGGSGLAFENASKGSELKPDRENH
jgi:hypothetical protein